MSKLKVDNFYQFFVYLIYLYYLIIDKEISMRKDIAIEKIKLGGEKVNKSKLPRRYGCCWKTID